MTLLDRIHTAGSDEHTVFGGTHTGGYFMQQEPECFRKLIDCLTAHKPIENYLAVGIAAGGAERFICEEIGIKALTIIDDGKHPKHDKWEINKKALMDKGVDVLQYIGDSHLPGAEAFLTSNPVKYDMASIDGDHFGTGPMQDFNLVKPHLKPGALVWFHDVNLHELYSVARTFDELSRKYEPILHTIGRCGIGVIRV